MGVSVLALGVSGTGKSASLRNFKSDEIALVNVAGKPLPFKGKFKQTLNSDDYAAIKDFIKKTGQKPVVIDDAQYLMGNEFMRRVTERGYDKFSEMAQNFWELLSFINKLDGEKRVYLLGHTERDQDGNEKFKTMGKLIDQCINVEGTCTIVLKTCVADGKYSFITQNSGRDTVKSPMGMFPAFAIDNDLKYVDEKIKNYYDFDGAVTNEEMASEDTAVISDISEDEAKGKKPRRTSRTSRSKTNEQEDSGGITEDALVDIPDDSPDEVPFDTAVPDVKPARRRTRRSLGGKVNPNNGEVREEGNQDKNGDMTGAKSAFDKAKVKYGTKSDPEPEEIETPDNETAGRRTRRTRK